MARVKFYLDTRGLKKSQEAPLKIKVTSHGVGAYVNIGVRILPSQWNDKRLRIVNHPQEDSLNLYIRKKELEVEEIVRGLPSLMNGKQMVDEVKIAIDKGNDQWRTENLFLNIYKRYADSRNAYNTRRLYYGTIPLMEDYDKNIGKKSFEEIDVKWLEGFDKYLTPNEPSPNSRSVHLKNIRAVFNHARQNLEITTAYPFYKFKFKFVETRKRSLTLEQMRMIINMEGLSPRIQMYADMFVLSFYLRGIRPVDLLELKKTDIVNGRLEYDARKCGVHYSVKIEPEAKELIEKHYGRGEFLLDCFDSVGTDQYRHYLAYMNRALKSVFPELSAYWSRHSWATIAVNLGIPIETVSAGLGHLHGLPTTLIYVAFNQKKVDDANRMVIDAVLNIRR